MSVDGRLVEDGNVIFMDGSLCPFIDDRLWS